MRHGLAAAIVVGVLGACDKAPEKPALPAKELVELSARLGEFNRRKIYDKLTLETLASIPDDKLEQAVLDFVELKVKARGGDEATVVRAMSDGFRAVWATSIAEGEINNGGFNQFFWNSSGQYAQDAAVGFERIGAPALAELMRKAIEVQHAEAKKLAALKAKGTLEAFSESYEDSAMSALDKAFYDGNDGISALRIAYIRKHAALFVAE